MRTLSSDSKSSGFISKKILSLEEADLKLQEILATHDKDLGMVKNMIGGIESQLDAMSAHFQKIEDVQLELSTLCQHLVTAYRHSSSSKHELEEKIVDLSGKIGLANRAEVDFRLQLANLESERQNLLAHGNALAGKLKVLENKDKLTIAKVKNLAEQFASLTADNLFPIDELT